MKIRKDSRLDLRITTADRQELERLAALEGRSLSNYMDRVIQEHLERHAAGDWKRAN